MNTTEIKPLTKIPLTRVCILCATRSTVVVNIEGYRAWSKGTPIQKALPELNENERELLISGVCGKCFDVMFIGD